VSVWQAAAIVAGSIAVGAVTALGILYYVLKDMYR
jgi:hypothetical protein